MKTWMFFLAATALKAAVIDSGSVVASGGVQQIAATNISSSGGGFTIVNSTDVQVTGCLPQCQVGDTISWMALQNGFNDIISGVFTVGSVTQVAQLRAGVFDQFSGRNSSYQLTAAPFTVTSALQQTTTFTMAGNLYGTIPTGLNTYIDVLTAQGVTGGGIVYMTFANLPGSSELYMTSSTWTFVPEPGSWGLTAAGLVGCAWWRRRKGRTARQA